jgi:signal transduction histidine kinase
MATARRTAHHGAVTQILDRVRATSVAAGLVAWALVALPTWLGALASPRLPAWIVAWLTCGAALIVAVLRDRLDRVMVVALAVHGAAVVAMVGLLCNGFEGMLLVLIAAQLGRVTGLGAGVPWLVVQTLAVATAIALHWTPRSAIMLMPPYLGFQLFALMVARAYAERAQRGQIEERLRIARDLHDVLGHHLTALSLNLEIAAHQSAGEARAHVRTAQSLARLLLGDIREITHAMQHGRAADLVDGLGRLAEIVPTPAVHVEVAPELRVADPRCAHALLRCAQEFVTNSIRHAGARNVWIAVARHPDELVLTARDDGGGAPELRPGGGLSGMRERLEALGGTLVIEPGEGFALRATVPA